MQTTDHQHDDAIQMAALWLAGDPERRRAIVPELKTRFGITALGAIEAIRIARRLREARAA